MLSPLNKDSFFHHCDYRLLLPTQTQNASLLNAQPDNHLVHHKATSTIPSYYFHNSHPPASNPRSFHNSIPSLNLAAPLPATQNLSSSIKTPPFFWICFNMLNFVSCQTLFAQSYLQPGISQILFFFFRFLYKKKPKSSLILARCRQYTIDFSPFFLFSFHTFLPPALPLPLPVLSHISEFLLNNIHSTFLSTEVR